MRTSRKYSGERARRTAGGLFERSSLQRYTPAVHGSKTMDTGRERAPRRR